MHKSFEARISYTLPNIYKLVSFSHFELNTIKAPKSNQEVFSVSAILAPILSRRDMLTLLLQAPK